MIFYFKPERLGGDIVGFKWDAPTFVEKYLLENLSKKMWAEMGRETGVRTDVQNRSLHLFFQLVADELNNSGQPIQMILKKFKIDLDWDKDSVKDILWRPVQKALTKKVSTTTLDKVSEIDTVYEHINRFLAEECNGIHVPFPSELTKNK